MWPSQKTSTLLSTVKRPRSYLEFTDQTVATMVLSAYNLWRWSWIKTKLLTTLILFTKNFSLNLKNSNQNKFSGAVKRLFQSLAISWSRRFRNHQVLFIVADVRTLITDFNWPTLLSIYVSSQLRQRIFTLSSWAVQSCRFAQNQLIISVSFKSHKKVNQGKLANLFFFQNPIKKAKALCVVAK